MTDLQYLSHQEQMEAYRRDFALFYAEKKAHLIAHCTPRKEIMLRELEAWNKWMKAHYRVPKHAR